MTSTTTSTYRVPSQASGTSDGDLIRRGRVRGGGHEIVLRHRAAAVPFARRTLLADPDVNLLDDELVDAVGVVASELVGNSVRHADPAPRGAVVLRWQVRGGVVDMEVTDGGSPGQVRPARGAVGSTSGRGLRIVRHLVDEWGVQEDRTSGQRTVWAALGGPSRRRRPLC